VSLLTPPARQIDPRGQRFGAGVSAALLALAIVLTIPWLAIAVGLNLAISAAFGTRLFLPGRAWPLVRTALRIGPPAETEHEYPPRFAQALGGTFVALATLSFLVGAILLGWILVAAVGALQTVLAVTGICIGCRLYFLRWWVPSVFARAFRRTDRLVALKAGSPIRYAGR
jgi:uncharacterized protein DUF4395